MASSEDYRVYSFETIYLPPGPVLPIDRMQELADWILPRRGIKVRYGEGGGLLLKTAGTYSRGVVTISRRAEMLTFLHEMAHAVVGRPGHGRDFRDAAFALYARWLPKCPPLDELKKLWGED